MSISVRHTDVIKAFLNGKSVEVLDKTTLTYVDDLAPAFTDDNEYRVKKSAKKAPSINWNVLSAEWIALAVGADDTAYLYREVPQLTPNGWTHSGQLCIPAIALASYKRGTIEWEDSLVTRPANTTPDPSQQGRPVTNP